MSRKKSLILLGIIVITVIIIITVITLRNKKNTAAHIPQPIRPKYQVTKVVDGDTIVVNIDGREETVRLIGVDSPEMVDFSKPVECYAQESSDFARNILNGKNIYLEADNTQDNRDKFNRLLRYIFLEDNTNLNLMIIKQGYGREYTYKGKFYKYRGEFTTAEKEAKESLQGLWSSCD